MPQDAATRPTTSMPAEMRTAAWRGDRVAKDHFEGDWLSRPDGPPAAAPPLGGEGCWLVELMELTRSSPSGLLNSCDQP
jgi:hypothetical protein